MSFLTVCKRDVITFPDEIIDSLVVFIFFLSIFHLIYCSFFKRNVFESAASHTASFPPIFWHQL